MRENGKVDFKAEVKPEGQMEEGEIGKEEVEVWEGLKDLAYLVQTLNQDVELNLIACMAKFVTRDPGRVNTKNVDLTINAKGASSAVGEIVLPFASKRNPKETFSFNNKNKLNFSLI